MHTNEHGYKLVGSVGRIENNEETVDVPTMTAQIAIYNMTPVLCTLCSCNAREC